MGPRGTRGASRGRKSFLRGLVKRTAEKFKLSLREFKSTTQLHSLQFLQIKDFEQ